MQNLIFKGLNGQFKIVAATQYITRIKDSTNKKRTEIAWITTVKKHINQSGSFENVVKSTGKPIELFEK